MSHFSDQPTPRLLGLRAVYEDLLEKQDPNYSPPVNKKTGKPGKNYPTPWMIPAWKKGLSLLNEELHHRGIQSETPPPDEH